MALLRIPNTFPYCLGDDDELSCRYIKSQYRYCTTDELTTDGFPNRMLRIYLKFYENYRCEKRFSSSHYAVVLGTYKICTIRVYKEVERLRYSPEKRIYLTIEEFSKIISNPEQKFKYIQCTHSSCGVTVSGYGTSVHLPMDRSTLQELCDIFTSIVIDCKNGDSHV